MAFGAYQPEPDQLKGLRQELDYNLDEFLRLTNEPAFKKFWGELKGEKLKTLPKGYSADNKAIEYLKLKELYFEISLKPDSFDPESFPKRVAEGLKLAYPVWTYLKKAMGREKVEA